MIKYHDLDIAFWGGSGGTQLATWKDISTTRHIGKGVSRPTKRKRERERPAFGLIKVGLASCVPLFVVSMLTC